jgi:hypothetical protein
MKPNRGVYPKQIVKSDTRWGGGGGYVEQKLRLFPSKTGFLISKKDWYRIHDTQISESAHKTHSKFWVLRSWRAAQAGLKGGRAEGTARTLGRAVSERGVYLCHTIRAHVSSLLSHHRWSNGQHHGLICRRAKDRISTKSKKKFELNWNFFSNLCFWRWQIISLQGLLSYDIMTSWEIIWG